MTVVVVIVMTTTMRRCDDDECGDDGGYLTLVCLGLWAMGSDLTEKKGLYAALNNCAFVSTESLKDCPSKPFVFLMDLAMLGFVIAALLLLFSSIFTYKIRVGVGFDTKGAGTILVMGPKVGGKELIEIEDSREGNTWYIFYDFPYLFSRMG